MAEQPARRGGEDHLAALALLEHLLAGGACHQPGLGDIGIHHVEEVFRLLVDDLGHFVQARGDHENIEAAELVDRGLDDFLAVLFRTRTQRDDLGLAAELLAFGRNLFQFALLACRQHHVGAGAGQRFRR